ncbi:MAG: hypothetical protein HY270_12210 [Deltaproteobacteria bacterium]|nr:hypothetical protein [Deltaproteobacteria bacterium]
MPTRALSIWILTAWYATPFLLISQQALAEGSVPILVLKEHGVGNPTQAQPYLDKFVALAAEQNGWDGGARGKYLTNRAAAESFIAAEKPHYAILSLPAFLALRGKYHLEVIGQVDSSLVGGREYHIISKTAASLDDCKGKPLASDHFGDERFLERVVAAGAFSMSSFTAMQTQRPLQTIRKVLGGEAACALIDDAQLAELEHIEGAGELHSVWKSQKLPPMVVVAFADAKPDERSHFRDTLDQLCDGDNQKACEEVGIVSLNAASDRDYSAAIAAYGH